jgi:hypothetical protein
MDTCYASSVILGYILCIGGLTESLVRTSSTALISYITTTERQNHISDLISEHLKNHLSDRVIIPIFATIELLLTCGLIPTKNKIFSYFLKRVINSKSPKKLLLGIKALGGFATLFDEVPTFDSKAAMSVLLSYLSHEYPKVFTK